MLRAMGRQCGFGGELLFTFQAFETHRRFFHQMRFLVVQQIVISFEFHPTNFAFPSALLRVRNSVFSERSITIIRIATVHTDVIFGNLFMNPSFVFSQHRMGGKLLPANIAAKTFLRVTLHVTLPRAFGG